MSVAMHWLSVAVDVQVDVVWLTAPRNRAGTSIHFIKDFASY